MALRLYFFQVLLDGSETLKTWLKLVPNCFTLFLAKDTYTTRMALRAVCRSVVETPKIWIQDGSSNFSRRTCRPSHSLAKTKSQNGERKS
ncbi:unnamed protein product [Amoebophrya sp. A25]|nr:unnamed protein product [Amoebophrya sp. A25]|eukprot:GSA25T00005703001.1